jgi:glycosyltransferase involved in cell wall biosynthesis
MGRVAWDCAREFRSAGYDARMLCFAHDPAFDNVSRTIDGVSILTIPRPQAHALNPFRAQRVIQTAQTAVMHMTREALPGLVHAHSVFMGAAGLRALGRQVPMLLTVHSPIVHEQRVNWSQRGLAGQIKSVAGMPYLRSLEQYVLRHAHVRHCLSRYTARLLREEYGTDFGTAVIPHWTDDRWRRTRPKAEARRLAGLPAAGPIFLSVRQLRYRYGIDTAIKAFGRVDLPAGTFVIAGAGSDEAALRTLAAQQPHPDKIRFMGRVTDDVLRLLYEAADYFLLPTRSLECFGLIILEAYGYGLPVLATDVAAIPELVAAVSPQMLVPPEDVDAMARAMQRVVDGSLPLPDPKRLENFAHGSFGREQVFPRYLDAVRACHSDR